MRNLRNVFEASARPLGIQVQLFEAKAPSDFDAAFTAMARARAEAMILFSSPMFYLEHRRLVEAAAKNRLPTMYYFVEAIQAGGLISYGVDNHFPLSPRRALRRQNLERCETRRYSRRAAHDVRTHRQYEDRQGSRPHHPAVGPVTGGSGDRMNRRAF